MLNSESDWPMKSRDNVSSCQRNSRHLAQETRGAEDLQLPPSKQVQPRPFSRLPNCPRNLGSATLDGLFHHASRAGQCIAAQHRRMRLQRVHRVHHQPLIPRDPPDHTTTRCIALAHANAACNGDHRASPRRRRQGPLPQPASHRHRVHVDARYHGPLIARNDICIRITFRSTRAYYATRVQPTICANLIAVGHGVARNF